MMIGQMTLPARYLIAAVVLAVYGLGASWVVHREAVAFRETLRPHPEAAQTLPAAALASKLLPRLDSTVDVALRSETAPPLAATPKSNLPAKIVDIPSEGLPEPAPKLVKTSESKAQAKGETVWDRPEVKKIWDIKKMSPEEKLVLGEQTNALILELNLPSQGGNWAGIVEDTADPLRESFAGNGVKYKFIVLDSEAFNAFSHTGGFVYVTTGLLLAIGNDKDALQFVLAHEMAHVEREHTLVCLGRLDMVRLQGLGTIEALYNLVIPLGYYDEQDLEADRMALDCLAGLKRERYEMLAFLRKLERYAKTHEFSEGRKKPVPGEVRSVIDNHLRAHLRVKTRLDRATKYVDEKLIPTPKK